MSQELEVQSEASVSQQVEAFLATIKASNAAKEFKDKKEKRLLLVVTVFSLVLAAAAIGAIYYLLPLKTIEPIIAVVDGTNGIVTSIRHFDGDNSKVEADEMLIKSNAYSYVTGRYGYAFVGNTDTLKERYARVKAFTSERISKQFFDEISKNNPNSPYQVYGEEGHVDVKIQNVSVLSGQRVQVLFKTVSYKNNSAPPVVNSYVALGKYITRDYKDFSVEDNWLNPFGFKFDEWTVTQNASNDAVGVSTNVSNAPVMNAPTAVETQTAPTPTGLEPQPLPAPTTPVKVTK